MRDRKGKFVLEILVVAPRTVLFGNVQKQGKFFKKESIFIPLDFHNRRKWEPETLAVRTGHYTGGERYPLILPVDEVKSE